MSYLLIAVFVLAVIMGHVIIPKILFIAFRKRLFDSVDTRKIHIGIVPRLGGLSFVPTQCCLMFLSFFIIFKFQLYIPHLGFLTLLLQFLLLVCGLVLLFIVGFADDLIGVDYKPKFIVQLIAALCFPFSDLWINNLYGFLGVNQLPEWIGMPLTVLVVVYIINSVNLIDGLDGLCSGIILLACLTLGGLFAYYAIWLHAFFAFITAGVLLSFFYYNVFGRSKGQHRIFMGDTGSLTLGYSVAFLVISYAMYNPDIKPYSENTIVIAFIPLAIPMLDVLRVLLIRLRAHKQLFSPDKNHLHHRLLRLGFTYRFTMIFMLLMAVFFSFLNIVLLKQININILVLVDFLVWGLFQMSFNLIERKQVNNKENK